jgi:hypothetical protein
LATVLVSLDFSKAYDCVLHDNLLEKLAIRFGFSSFAVKLMANYLHGRLQILISEKYPPSAPLSLLRGIPQGGIFCCLLFIMYFDLFPLLSCKHHAFADDLQLFASGKISDLSAVIQSLNENISTAQKWCESN